MSNNKWLIFILLSFIFSPTASLIALGLYVFNFITAAIYRFWSIRHYRGQQ